MNPVDRITMRIARTTYVILVKDKEGKPTLLMDPGLGQPWHSKNKRLADWHAGQNKGEAWLAVDAFAYLLKQCPTFERDLHARIAQAAQEQTVRTLSDAKNIPGIIDSHGNPTN